MPQNNPLHPPPGGGLGADFVRRLARLRVSVGVIPPEERNVGPEFQ